MGIRKNFRQATLFGFPVMIEKIDKESYDKKSIISTIEKNFKLNKKRNLWEGGSVEGALQSGFKEYHKINVTKLLPIYQEILTNMFKRMNILSTFRFIIANYTCLSKADYMKPHIHPDSDFTAVHYIQFDKKHHTPTMFENTLSGADYLMHLRPQLPQILSSKDPINSWAYMDWSLDIEEDDFCFAPAYLKHRVDAQTSKDKNRITIVLNITFK